MNTVGSGIMARNATTFLLPPKLHNTATKNFLTWCFALVTANVGVEELRACAHTHTHIKHKYEYNSNIAEIAKSFPNAFNMAALCARKSRELSLPPFWPHLVTGHKRQV